MGMWGAGEKYFGLLKVILFSGAGSSGEWQKLYVMLLCMYILMEVLGIFELQRGHRQKLLMFKRGGDSENL